MIIDNGIYKVGNDWDIKLDEIYNDKGYRKLCDKLEELYASDLVSPSRDDIFKAFELTSFNNVKVVILGQDPYPVIGDANGLAFSYTGNGDIPSTLKNIFKALENDYGKKRKNTDLTDWSKQGVLLLNSILTIEKGGERNSHRYLKWYRYINRIIKILSIKEEPIVFVLWGQQAMSKEKYIAPHHKIIKSYHPSNLSVTKINPNGTTFLTSQPFLKINNNLRELGYSEIDWYKGDKVKVKKR